VDLHGRLQGGADRHHGLHCERARNWAAEPHSEVSDVGEDFPGGCALPVVGRRLRGPPAATTAAGWEACAPRTAKAVRIATTGNYGNDDNGKGSKCRGCRGSRGCVGCGGVGVWDGVFQIRFSLACGAACHLEYAPISAAKEVLGGMVLKPGTAVKPV